MWARLMHLWRGQRTFMTLKTPSLVAVSPKRERGPCMNPADQTTHSRQNCACVTVTQGDITADLRNPVTTTSNQHENHRGNLALRPF